MSANIEIQADGTASFVAAREPAWHRLGKVYPDRKGLSVERVLRDLDTGELVEMEVQGTLGNVTVTDPSKKMIVRMRKSGNTPVGVVGRDYTLITEDEAFRFLDNITDTGEALISSAGLLAGGSRAFCCMKLPEQILVGGHDAVDQYIFVAMSHDGSLSLTAAVTPIRVVCQNTITAGLQQAVRTWRVRHTSKAQLRVEEARRALSITHRYMDTWQAEMEQLIAKPFSDKQYENLVTTLHAPKGNPADWSKATKTAWDKKQDVLMRLWTEADTNAAIKGTAYGALNAMYEYGDWFRTTRGAADATAQQFTTSLMSGAGIVATLANYKDRTLGLIKARVGVK